MAGSLKNTGIGGRSERGSGFCRIGAVTDIDYSQYTPFVWRWKALLPRFKLFSRTLSSRDNADPKLERNESLRSVWCVR